MTPFDQMIKIVGRWTVTVEMEYTGDLQFVAAADNSQSKIEPLKKADGSYDRLAVDEYEDFVINLLGVFDRADFDVIEERKSPRSYSYYFDLVKKDQSNKKDYKYILYVRVSDHDLDPEKASKQKDWYKNHAEIQKRPESKSKQVWKLRRITVNKDTYYSYDEALEDLEERLQKM